MLITRDQIRAARALLDWSQLDLAQRTGLARPTIVNIESGQQDPNTSTLDKIFQAFHAQDVEFGAHEAVRIKQTSVQTLLGREGFKSFFNDILLPHALTNAGQIFVSNVMPKFYRMCWPEFYESDYVKQMAKLKEKVKDKLDHRLLTMEGDMSFPVSDYASYRWLPKQQFNAIPFYVFGDYVAIIFFMDEPVIFALKSKESADLYREKFEALWDKAIIPPSLKETEKKKQS